MDFRDNLSALLPPHRDDEPASLRQDILDELGDHLACAYEREALHGLDSNLSRQHVLERFGDPAAVARRLWLDAMKGKIMVQRALIATCLVVMLTCVASVGLAWHWINQNHLLSSRTAAEAIEANRRLSEALAQSQSTNAVMLQQMRDMSEAVRHPSSLDWNPVTFKLTEETADGPPAVGFTLALTRLEGNMVGMSDIDDIGARPLALALANNTRRPLRVLLPPGILAEGATGQMGGMGGMGGGMGRGMGGAMAKAIYRTSDISGSADFGAVPPGDYRYLITKVWAKGYFGTTGQLNVRPGSQVQKSIVCPKAPPERATVRVRCTWPADLQRQQLVLYAPFAFRYRKLEPSLEWTLSDSVFPERMTRRSNPDMMFNRFGGVNALQRQPATRSVLCGPGTLVAEILKFKGLYLWTSAQGDLAFPVRNGAGAGTNGGNIVRRSFGGDNQGAALERIGPGARADILLENLREVKLPSQSPKPEELEWETGTYGLDELIVLRPSRSQNAATGTRQFDVLVACRASSSGPWFRIQDRVGPPGKTDLEANVHRNNGQVGGMARQGDDGWRSVTPTIDLPTEFWDEVDVAFEARHGQVNEWTIPFPDELINAVRDALKIGPTANAKPAGPAAPVDDK